MCSENASFQAVISSYRLTFTGVKTHKPINLCKKQRDHIFTSMVKSNVMWANDLAPLLAEDIPSHKCWLTIFMRFIVLFDWQLQ